MYHIIVDVADVPAVLLTHGTYSFLRFPHGFLLMLDINPSMVAVSLNKILICKTFKQINLVFLSIIFHRPMYFSPNVDILPLQSIDAGWEKGRLDRHNRETIENSDTANYHAIVFSHPDQLFPLLQLLKINTKFSTIKHI